MRKLASIQRIKSVSDIPNRDRIGLAEVLGWHVIVNKSDFIPGDLCVYCEIDSILPEKPEFEFLRSKNFRIRTMKMAGCISQGICFPLSILPPGDYKQGDDVTELIGVKKYDEYVEEQAISRQQEKPSKLRNFMFRHNVTRPIAKTIWRTKTVKLPFPEEVAKTDEVRIQTIPEILTGDTAQLSYDVREKIDGCSATYLLRKRKGLKRFIDPYEFIVCSRNMALPEDDSVYWQMAKKYKIEHTLRKLALTSFVCLQGEIVGPKIQGNPYGLTEPDLYLFNLILPGGRMAADVAEQWMASYGLKWVPLICGGFRLLPTVDDMLAYATGKSALADVPREGVVVRNYMKKISFKCVSPEYLIKHGK